MLFCVRHLCQRARLPVCLPCGFCHLGAVCAVLLALCFAGLSSRVRARARAGLRLCFARRVRASGGCVCASVTCAVACAVRRFSMRLRVRLPLPARRGGSVVGGSVVEGSVVANVVATVSLRAHVLRVREVQWL